ncbi:3',5'-cyclic AMP phosphodiesterase CpdA [Verrucomicrobium sp. GAS474]|uniref:metallophosphoesterase family protein n=1 Tax=Verrucomicrobium sp. GAS474 TaxID=1882831 RepID=UPI00087B844C|nr:metallophosphoesterase [Verrucomicrobium sp. GAS474]SDT91115.1 3',5'-cyclic AMP phosphodiesterase CpdA [Verrucomicrobium sp. GAS474]
MDKNDLIHDISKDGVDRRGFLKCMAWTGTGLVWSINGGILSSAVFGANSAAAATAELNFVQISDTHVGFNKPANQNVLGTFQETVKRINTLPKTPDFILHTGDLTHLAADEQFDTVDQVLKGAKASQVFYVPGEHDILNDKGAQYLQRFGKGTQGNGWYSFDQKGVHFIGLVNVFNDTEGGMGILGADQLDWLKKDLAGLATSTPIVVFAHIPLWEVYAQWGWGTTDGAQALALLKRFGSVTVLNGHIHQAMQKIEGNMTFHTARSTAFPQPAPGSAPKPGPMVVPAEQLRGMLGLTRVSYVETDSHLAIVDSTLA